MGSPVEERCRERRALDPEMCCHIGEDTRERADAETRVIGDRDMMLTALLRCEPHVTPRLARHRVSIAT